MTSLNDLGFVSLTFVFGVVARLAIAVLVLAALVVPLMVAAEAWPRVLLAYRRLRGAATVEGLEWRRDAYYAAGHTWLRVPPVGRRVRIGLDGLAARLVPWARSITLPRRGELVHRGDVVAEFAWGDRRAPILSPVDGTVSRINAAVVRDPALALRDPYGRGWLFTVAPTDSWRRGLRHGPMAREWFAMEARALTRIFESDLGLSSADGGHLVAPGLELVSDEGWRALRHKFLGAP